MGGVGYRVSETVLSGATRDEPSLTRLVASLRAAGARLYGRVDIGAVDITPSREALRDTDTTICAVRRVLIAVRDGITAAVQAELDSHPDIARAGFALATIRPRIAGLHDTVARRGFTWRGEQISGTQVLPLPSYTLDRSRQSRPTLTVQESTQVALEALTGVLIVTGVPRSGSVLRAARRYLIEHREVTCLLISGTDSGGTGWLSFGPGLPVRTIAYREFKDHAALVAAPSAGRSPTRYQTTPVDTYRQVNLTAAEITDLTGEIIAFPDHLASTPLGRLVARDRTVIALNSQQSCAALIRRVPAVLDGETAMQDKARHLMTALTDTDRALLHAQQIVGSRERAITRIRELLRPVLDRITGQTLRDLLSEFDQAKRLVTASPGRIALLGQAEQLHPRPTRPDALTPVEELLDRHLPLLGMALRIRTHYSPVTLTNTETAALLTHVNTETA